MSTKEEGKRDSTLKLPFFAIFGRPNIEYTGSNMLIEVFALCWKYKFEPFINTSFKEKICDRLNFKYRRNSETNTSTRICTERALYRKQNMHI